MRTEEELKSHWLEKAKERSIEKFGFNIIGLDLDKLESHIRHRSERVRKSNEDLVDCL